MVGGRLSLCVPEGQLSGGISLLVFKRFKIRSIHCKCYLRAKWATGLAKPSLLPKNISYRQHWPKHSGQMSRERFLEHQVLGYV